jgi:hypothetical protein
MLGLIYGVRVTNCGLCVARIFGIARILCV